MDKTSEIRVRIEPQLKGEAVKILTLLGLNISDAIRLFLQQVVAQKNFPLQLKKPNAQNLTVLQEAREMAKTAKSSCTIESIPSRKAIGNTVKRLRKERKLQQQQLAKEVGMTGSRLSMCEHGKLEFTFVEMFQILQVLNVTHDSFLATALATEAELKTLNEI